MELSRETQIILTCGLKPVLDEIDTSIKKCGDLAANGKLCGEATDYFSKEIGVLKNVKSEIHALIGLINIGLIKAASP